MGYNTIVGRTETEKSVSIHHIITSRYIMCPVTKSAIISCFARYGSKLRRIKATSTSSKRHLTYSQLLLNINAYNMFNRLRQFFRSLKTLQQ